MDMTDTSSRYISMEDWRKIVRASGPIEVTMLDPGYVNEPYEEPRIGSRNG